MKLLLLSLLVLFATSSNIFVRQYDLDFMEPSSSNNDKVKLDFFYESLCPYCGQFINSALKTAVATPVSFPLSRISGRSVNSTCTPTAMRAGRRMEPVGPLPASMG